MEGWGECVGECWSAGRRGWQASRASSRHHAGLRGLESRLFQPVEGCVPAAAAAHAHARRLVSLTCMESGADQKNSGVSSTVDSRLTALFWINTRPAGSGSGGRCMVSMQGRVSLVAGAARKGTWAPRGCQACPACTTAPLPRRLHRPGSSS